jgi:peptidoglycan/LPS O-acetylase OafA/YrhL
MDHAQPKLTSGYLPTLDGWRAVAILSVLCCHTKLFAERMQRWQQLCSLGVDLFFAISGLLITYWLVQELEQTNTICFRSFYIRRAFRILPAAILFLIVLSIFGVTKVLPVRPSNTVAAALFYRNYYFGVHNQDWFSGHFWSLSVEEHFYMFWPCLLLLMGLRRARRLTPLIAVAVAAWRTLDCHLHLVPNRDLWFLFTRTDYRVDALLWGCTAALLLSDTRLRKYLSVIPSFWPLPCLAIVIALAWKQPQQWMTLIAILIPTAIISTVLYPTSAMGRVLENRLLGFIGKLSYSIYLWQQLFFVHEHAGRWGILQQFPLNAAIVLLVAWTSYSLVEVPLRNVGKRLSLELLTRSKVPEVALPSARISVVTSVGLQPADEAVGS